MTEQLQQKIIKVYINDVKYVPKSLEEEYFQNINYISEKIKIMLSIITNNWIINKPLIINLHVKEFNKIYENQERSPNIEPINKELSYLCRLYELFNITDKLKHDINTGKYEYILNSPYITNRIWRTFRSLNAHLNKKYYYFYYDPETYIVYLYNNDNKLLELTLGSKYIFYKNNNTKIWEQKEISFENLYKILKNSFY